MKQPDASTLDLLPNSGVAWKSCEECHHCTRLSRHGDAVQAQSSHGSLTWLLLGMASKLLFTAGLSMQRMAAYADTLPHCKVTATHTQAMQQAMQQTAGPHVPAENIGAHSFDNHSFFSLHCLSGMLSATLSRGAAKPP